MPWEWTGPTVEWRARVRANQIVCTRVEVLLVLQLCPRPVWLRLVLCISRRALRSDRCLLESMHFRSTCMKSPWGEVCGAACGRLGAKPSQGPKRHRTDVFMPTLCMRTTRWVWMILKARPFRALVGVSRWVFREVPLENNTGPVQSELAWPLSAQNAETPRTFCF